MCDTVHTPLLVVAVVEEVPLRYITKLRGEGRKINVLAMICVVLPYLPDVGELPPTV